MSKDGFKKISEAAGIEGIKCSVEPERRNNLGLQAGGVERRGQAKDLCPGAEKSGAGGDEKTAFWRGLRKLTVGAFGGGEVRVLGAGRKDGGMGRGR